MRRNGAEAQHRAAATGMPIARPVPIVVTIRVHRGIMRMSRQFAIRMVVLMSGRELIRALHRQVDRNGDRE